MKRIIILIGLAAMPFANAQLRSGLDAPRPNPREQKAAMEGMTTEQKKAYLRQFRDDMMVQDLKIPAEKQEEFKSLYHDYLDDQRRIRESYQGNFDPDKLSDAEASQKLQQSFSVGQQLLDSRKEHARKLQTVVRPQQVLKMFRNEGMMREKMMDRRMENGGFGTPNPSRGTGGFKNGAGSKAP